MIRTINILLVLILSVFLSINSYSQNIEPSQRTFTIGGVSGQSVDNSNSYFKINNFLLGWHWGDEYSISKALQMNQKDVSSGSTSPKTPNTNLFIRSSYTDNSNVDYNFYSHVYFDKHQIFGKSLKYDPTLYIDPSNVYKLNKRVGDPSNPVFGFLYRRGTITNNQSDPNYSRVIIRGDSLKNQVVLKDNWPNDIMYYVPGDGSPAQNEIEKDFSGRSFFVSINLRRYGGTSSSSPNTQILKIRVPYTIWTSKTTQETKYAYFYGVPASGNLDYTTLPSSYGKAWNLNILTDSATRPQEIYITEKMLPSSPLESQDITISGYIDFAGIDGVRTNHILKRYPQLKDGDNYDGNQLANGQKIDKLKIEVEYLNSDTEVAIDWVKFESPNAKRINCGQYDDNIAESVQRDLDFFTNNSGYASNNIKPSRWIIHIEGSPINWEAERHFRKIVGDVTTGAVGGSLGAHWDEFIGNADKWIELSSLSSYVASPYCISNVNNNTESTITHGGVTKTNSNLWKTLSMKQGCLLNEYRDAPNQILDRYNSGYETFIRSKTATVDSIRNLPIEQYSTSSEYVAYSQGKISFQAYWEWMLYNNYSNNYISGFAYSDKPWFGQHFAQEFLKEEDHWAVESGNLVNIKSYRIEDFRRMQTAEETSLFIWNPLIMGAKGLMYDGGADYSFIASGSNKRDGQTKLLPSEVVLKARFGMNDEQLYGIDDYEFINSNNLTGDFLDDKYEHIPFMSKLIPSGHESMLNDIATAMGTVKKMETQY